MARGEPRNRRINGWEGSARWSAQRRAQARNAAEAQVKLGERSRTCGPLGKEKDDERRQNDGKDQIVGELYQIQRQLYVANCCVTVRVIG